MSYLFTVEGKGFGGHDPGDVRHRHGRLDPRLPHDGCLPSETTTLGGQTANESYTGQYTGQDASLSGVNAISGATITSTAYRGCVETAFEAFESCKGGAEMSKLQNFLKGLIKENPVLVLVLGTCPTLAISTSVIAEAIFLYRLCSAQRSA